MNEGGGEAVLALVNAGRSVGQALHRCLAELGLSDLKFGALVALYTLDPTPLTSADLAFHNEASRSAMTDALDQLEAQHLVGRQRDRNDRRVIYVRLTAGGRQTAAQAIKRFLTLASDLGGALEPSERAAFGAICDKLRERARHAAA